MKRHQTTLLLSETELDQIWRYCIWAEESGVYYGPKVAFDKRHSHILKQLEAALASAEAKQ